MNPIGVNSCSSVVLFNFPESCRVNQRIGKTLFADNSPLTPTDRRTLRNEVEEIICSYILDENHGIMLTPYSVEEHDYSCLMQIDVFLKKTRKAARVAELCHRAMPYPLIVILHNAESLKLSMAEKRFSRDGKEQIVLEQSVCTDWVQLEKLAEFRDAADFTKSKKMGFRDLYLHYMTLLDVLECAEITGMFKEDGLTPETRRSLLVELHQLNQKLAEIKAEAKKENELSLQVELNLQANQIKHNIEEIYKKI